MWIDSRMTNEYICNFENCEVKKHSDEMFFLRSPKSAYFQDIQRFCKLEHLAGWVLKEEAKRGKTVSTILLENQAEEEKRHAGETKFGIDNPTAQS